MCEAHQRPERRREDGAPFLLNRLSLLHLCIVGEVSRELQRPAAASIMYVMQILHVEAARLRRERLNFVT